MMTTADSAFSQALEPLVRGRLEYRANRGDLEAQRLLDQLTNAWAQVGADVMDQDHQEAS